MQGCSHQKKVNYKISLPLFLAAQYFRRNTSLQHVAVSSLVLPGYTVLLPELFNHRQRGGGGISCEARPRAPTSGDVGVARAP